MRTRPRSIMAGFILAGFIFSCFLALRMVVTDLVVELSKNEEWSQEFHDHFIHSCSEEALHNYQQDLIRMDRISMDEILRFSRTLSLDYCGCVAHNLKERKIIPTRYNTISGFRHYEKTVEGIISDFLSSPEGAVAIEDCNDFAVTKLQASMNGDRVPAGFPTVE